MAHLRLVTHGSGSVLARTVLGALVLASTLASAAVPKPAPPAPVAAFRWTDETPDAMIDDARARALAPGASEADVLAAIVVIRALEPRATYGRADDALRAIAGGAKGDVATEAALAFRALADDEGTDDGTLADRALGIVSHLSVLGPFRDTGGGLLAHEGPEAPGGSFSDTRARYAWGTVDVAWRKVPVHYVTAGGVPLDLFISPRTESCTLLATAVTLEKAEPIVVRLAASGSARLIFDGVDVATGEDVNPSAQADRLAAQVSATVGTHLLAAKVCKGALADDGHVRFRITDVHGAPVRVTYAELSALPTSASHPTKAEIAALAVKPVATPLGRTLAARSDVPGGVLDAAIARTLGGAEDSRSPRAPGLLDSLLHPHDGARGGHAPELTPDELAMIGWVTPSGANRTADLNRALVRAAGLDARTGAFVQRRLIAERMSARFPDWAMATAQGVHLGHTDAEALLLHALLAEALGTDALRAGALRELGAYVAGNPSAPTALLFALARLSDALDPARALAVRQQLATRGYRGALLVTALGARGGDAMAVAARRAFDGGLDDSDDGLAVARVLARAGQDQAALAAFAQMLEWAPNRADAWSGAADALTAVHGGGDAHVIDALKRARELAPGEARIRAELALRDRASDPSRQPAAGSGARDDEKYLVAPEVFLSRRRGVPPGIPDVADRELYWLRAVILHPDRRVSQLIQYAKEIVIPPRTQDDLLEDIPAEGDLTEILRARVHRKDGSVSFPAEEHNEGSRPEIRWPELQPGDTVEVAIRTWTRGAVGGRGDAPYYFIDYAGAPTTHPLLYNEVVIEAPRSSPIYLDVLHGDADRREEHDDGDRHVTRLVWDHPAIIPDEPLSPALTEIAPIILGSTFKDWSEFRSWYTGAIQGFTTPDDEVRRLAAELTRGKNTRDEKLAALFDFVADDIRYVNYQSGEGWLPNRPQQLLARREGDCDDKAILLITLLRAIGIEAEEVLVQTREKGEPSVVRATKAAVPKFDHGIAFLPGPGGGQYLDATSPQSRLGPLPSMDARAPAFRIQAGPAEMTSLPSSTPAEHGADTTWTLTLHPDGAADLAGEQTAVGDSAFWLRSSLSQPDARADYVRDNLVAPWIPTVVVDKKVDFKGDLPRGTAWVKYTAHAGGYARSEQGELVVSIAQSQAYASQLASLVTRTLPVVLPAQLAPSHQSRTTHIVAPPGFRWAPLPLGGDENGGDFGRAHLEISRDPGSERAVLVKRMVVFDQHLIPASKYPSWRAWLQRVDRLLHKDLRLVATTPRKGDR